jgi:hypothetical protein
MTDTPINRMPRGFSMGHEYATMLGGAIGNWKAYRAAEANDPVELDYMNPLRLRTIMGYVIPDWQRPLVWSQTQMIRFVESLWMGTPVGTYTINIDPTYGNGNLCTRNILVDGQQRMWALQQYLENAFPVFDLYYRDLNLVERRSFEMIKWSSFETDSQDEAYIRDYYNRMNFGGTAHTEDQRA